MTSKFPTRKEIKCAGCSFVIAQILLGVAMVMHSIDYNLYSVNNEEQVIQLHHLLSSSEHRTQIEIGVALIWLSFPFLLIGLYGIKKLLLPIYQDTASEMFIYLVETSYIIFISVITIIIPAISITASSFEWSFHEYTPEPDWIPTGYYVQLFILTFNIEVFDCVAIADATFMISLFLMPRVIVKDTVIMKKLKSIMDPDLPSCLQNMRCLVRCYNIMIILFALSLFFIFCVILFEFASSGFHSPTGHAKYLVIWSFIVKIMIGFKVLILGFSSRYDAFKQIFGDNHQLNS